MENGQFKVQLLCSNSILGRFIVCFGLNALKRVGIKRCITNCSKWTKLFLFVLSFFTGNSFADGTLCERFRTLAETATVDSPVGFKLDSD